MQIAVGASKTYLLINETPQRGSHHRSLFVPHAGVADQREILLELGGVLLDESEQMIGPALLLALDHHRDRQRQRAADRLVGAQGLDKSHDLAFVVAGAARDDDLAAIG